MKRLTLLLLAAAISTALYPRLAEASCVGHCFPSGSGVTLPLESGSGGTGADLSGDTGVLLDTAGTISVGTAPIANGGTGATTAPAAFKALASFACHNASGVDLTAGQLVTAEGSQGTAALDVGLADADLSGYDATAIVTATIADGNDGVCYYAWRSTANLDTNAGSVGDLVYLSTTAGGWTLTPLTGASSIQREVGVVAVKSATVGVIEFNLLAFAGHRIGTNEIQDAAITEAKLGLVDTTTGDVTSSAHGFMPKATGGATDCYLGDGSIGPCPGSAGSNFQAFSDNKTLACSDAGVVVMTAVSKAFTLPTGCDPGTSFTVFTVFSAPGYLSVVPNGADTIFPSLGGVTLYGLGNPNTSAARTFSYDPGDHIWFDADKAVDTWNSTGIYMRGQIVATTGNVFYVALANGETNHDPATDDGTYWKCLSCTAAPGITAQDEGGSSLGTFTNLNCIGAGVACTDGGSGTLAVTVAGGGGGSFSGVEFVAGVAANVVTATWTELPYYAITYDVTGWHAATNNYVTVPSTGYYRVALAGLDWTSNATGYRYSKVEINATSACNDGANALVTIQQNPQANGYPQPEQSRVVYLTAADTLRMCVYQTSGGNLDASPGYTATLTVTAQ